MDRIRNIPALSREECDLLREKTVAVIGCGGLGGYLAEQLARLGVGQIRFADGDVFDETNGNRQLLCTDVTLGRNKAEAAAQRVREIDPQIQVRAFAVNMDARNAKELIAGCDVVLDGLDNIPARKILAQACREAKIPWVYGAVSGWVAQAAVCMPADRLVEKLYPTDAEPKDKSVLAFTPALCAGMQMALCVKLLTGRPVRSGVLHHWDVQEEMYTQLKV